MELHSTKFQGPTLGGRQASNPPNHLGSGLRASAEGTYVTRRWVSEEIGLPARQTLPRIKQANTQEKRRKQFNVVQIENAFWPVEHTKEVLQMEPN